MDLSFPFHRFAIDFRSGLTVFPRKPFRNVSVLIDPEIFYINGNSLQAKQTLQSIIDNYDGDDLVQEATQRRNEIIQEENSIKAQASNNDSSELDEINVDEN